MTTTDSRFPAGKPPCWTEVHDVPAINLGACTSKAFWDSCGGCGLHPNPRRLSAEAVAALLDGADEV